MVCMVGVGEGCVYVVWGDVQVCVGCVRVRGCVGVCAEVCGGVCVVMCMVGVGEGCVCRVG